MKKVKLGIIGLGARAETLFASIKEMRQEAELIAICDCAEEKLAKFRGIIGKTDLKQPQCFTDYHEMLRLDELEAVLIPTSWNSHLHIACDVMKCGKYAGIEVGGASSLEELWSLVHAAETSGGQCTMLENCCYGRDELLVWNMVRQGLFGELIHCECGYEHDLADELIPGLGRNQERPIHNLRRNGDLYPTHGLGPISKILGINRGNRYVSLVSVASKSRRLTELARQAYPGSNYTFNNGDVTTTILKCANGETVTMTHGIALPRPYSRNCRVQGTRGIWLENAGGIYIEGISPTKTEIDAAGNPYTVHSYDKVSDCYEKYDHPLWRNYNPIGGHGGMDALALRAFFDAVSRRATPAIDVYDVCAWMCVTALSEQSIAMGGAPVAVPDFTGGKWVSPAPRSESVWSLDIC